MSLNIFRLSLNIFRLSLNIFRLSLNIFRLSLKIFRLSLKIFRLSLNIFRLSLKIFRFSLKYHPLCVTLYEIQKITDKQFILSIFINTILKLIYYEIIIFLRLFASLACLCNNMKMCDTFTLGGPHQAIFFMQNGEKK